MPREAMERMDAEGDFAKRHLVNPTLLRMLGDVAGRRVLDAGCGQGYLSRMLAARGATVLGVEPAAALFDYSVEREAQLGQGIRYVRADLCELPDLGEPFDVCVSSMVMACIPEWERALAACVERLRSGGVIVVTLNHPCFERLWTAWREHGEYRLDRYLADYEIQGLHGVDFHRPLSVYLNKLIGLGCRIREVAEPGLSEAAAAEGPAGIEAYCHLPNFVLIAAERS
jgi:SAM-dependent methyltransferase